jgi:hypothetical protein
MYRHAYSFVIGALGLAAVVGSTIARTHTKWQGQKDKALREHLNESQVDDMVNDSFPASDPPSTY